MTPELLLSVTGIAIAVALVVRWVYDWLVRRKG